MTDLDNAASESTDISNTDIENFKNDIQKIKCKKTNFSMKN